MGTKSFLRSIVLAFAATSCLMAPAQKASDFDPLTATIEENIRTPKVNPKHSEAVVAEMKTLQKSLTAAKYHASAVRSGEVIMVTIPCSSLFGPNSTELTKKGRSLLSPLKPYVHARSMYKVVVAVHSDDTGDQTYADRITDERSEAIDEYFSADAPGKDSGIIPYGLGSDEPIAPNSSISRRSSNRRVEIYFIPTEATIQKARKR